MSEAFINVRNTPKRVAFCKNLDLLFSVGYFVFRGTFFFFPHLDSPLLSSLLLSDCFKEQVSTTPWGPVIESAEGRTECRNLIKNATENTYIIQIYILMPLLCQHKNCPEMSCYLRISQVMLSKSAGEEKKKRSPVLNRMLNSLTSGEIKIRGTDLAEAWRLFSLTKDGMTHFWQAHHVMAGGRNPPSSVLRVFISIE